MSSDEGLRRINLAAAHEEPVGGLQSWGKGAWLEAVSVNLEGVMVA